METTPVDWPPWPVGDAPALGRYVVPGEVARHARVPGASGESARARLRAVWDALREAGTGYATEPTGGGSGHQLIRTPAEVLRAPGNGTCVDLALVLAAACLHAGLEASVLIIEPTRSGPASHALVAVLLSGSWPTGTAETFWARPQAELTASVRASLTGSARPVVVLDPVGLARSLGSTRTTGTDTPVEESTAAGHRYLTDGQWALTLTVTATRRSDAYRPAPAPRVLPLREPSRAPDSSESALRLLRAEYQLTPFQARDELIVLEDFCEQVAAAGRTGVAVVSGRGGAGKTRLAIQLAHRMRIAGWYTGVLRERLPDPGSIGWLATGGAPLLAVVDYADARVEQVIALLQCVRERRTPTVLVLAARSTDGDWLDRITGTLTSDAHPYRMERIELPEAHPRPRDVFRHTFAAVAGSPAHAAPVLPAPRWGSAWTTLDLVLLGWLAATGTRALPETPAALYDEVLDHERRYWQRTFTQLGGGPAGYAGLLGEAAACLTLLSPAPEHAAAALRAVTRLEQADEVRRTVAETMTICLDPGPGEGLAIRPDPVGDHHLLATLGSRPELLERCLAQVPADTREEEGIPQALAVLARAGQHDEAAAMIHIEALLRAEPGRWPVAVAVATAGGGAALRVLESLVEMDDCPVPLDDLAEALPFQPGGLWRLALRVDERRLAAVRGAAHTAGHTAAHTAGRDRSRYAELLLRTGHRRADAGDRPGALRAVTEATEVYQGLVGANPELLPRLALSLNHLSTRRAETGDLTGALSAITDATTLYDRLATTEPDRYLPDLAGSLNNLGARAEECGQFDRALAHLERAVDIWRGFADRDAARFTADLAMALINLASARNSVGDRSGALHAVTEAEALYRQLASADPLAYRPFLAGALHNLAAGRSDNADRAGALLAAQEAVQIRRDLAQANPEAFRPWLAGSLTVLANRQAETGDADGALRTAGEGVELLTDLVRANRSAFLPELALALNGLSNRQADTGDLAGALRTSERAAELGRELVTTHPTFRSDLAVILNTLFAGHSETGDLGAALAAVTEAAELGRAVAAEDPGSFDDELASILANLAVARSEVGDVAGALAAITESVDRYRSLAKADPVAFAPDLASVLNTLANQRAEAGDLTGALAAIDEAVRIRRDLAAAEPAAFTADLAATLNNLAHIRAEGGDVWTALAAADEAVTRFRSLVDGGASAYRPKLATALMALSNTRAATGDTLAALSAITEASDILRGLAEQQPQAFHGQLARTLLSLANRRGDHGDASGAAEAAAEAVALLHPLARAEPGAFRPSLAGALNSLAVHRSRDGETAGALAAAEEALSHFRALAEQFPAVFLPELAMCLNNLAGMRFEHGDPEAALPVGAEAVRAYRGLVTAGRREFLPDLAMALHNNGVWRAGAGDKSGAAGCLAEAAAIRRRITRRDPMLMTPSLIASTRALAGLRRADGQSTRAARSWRQAVTAASTVPCCAAEVRATYGAWQLEVGARAAAVRLISRAAWEADTVGDEVPAHIVSRIRRTVRGCVEQLGDAATGLPGWASTPIPPEVSALATAWARAGGWRESRAVLDEHRGLLCDPDTPAALAALHALFPADPGLESLRALMEEIGEHGFDPTVEDLADGFADRQLIDQWLGCVSVDAVMDFLIVNEHRLRDEEIAEMLRTHPHPQAGRRLAVLDLTGSLPAELVRELLADPAVAADHALVLIEECRLDTLAQLTAAEPAVLDAPGTGRLATAILLIRHGDTAAGVAVGADLAREVTDLQRWATIVRLRRLRHRAALPDEARDALDALVATLAGPDT